MIKILFLEDEKMIREVLTEYMTLTGYEVVGCEDGEEAINLIEMEDFDIAILDIRVPKKNGLEVLKYIRDVKKSDIGVIMLTAYEDEATQVEAFNLFADDYITKPASPIILLKRIEVLVRRINADLKIKDNSLVIDEESYRVLYKGEDLNFTLTEFLILKLFYDSPKRVYTRENIIDLIFDDSYIVSTRSVDAHIKNIRKKLPFNTIETIIGLGYRWKDIEDET